MYVHSPLKNDNPRFHECDTNFVVDGNCAYISKFLEIPLEIPCNYTIIYNKMT